MFSFVMSELIVKSYKYLPIKLKKLFYLVWIILRITFYTENFNTFEVNLICTIKEILFYALELSCLDVHIPLTEKNVSCLIFPFEINHKLKCLY